MATPVVLDHRCPQDHRCPLLNLCPVDAIQQNGYELPYIDGSKCTECGICVETCPSQAVINSIDDRGAEDHTGRSA